MDTAARPALAPRSLGLLTRAAGAALAWPFVRDGIDAMRRPEVHAERLDAFEPLLERTGLAPVVRRFGRLGSQVTGGISVAAGLGLTVGVAPRACAGTLAGLSVPVALLNNPIWTAADAPQRKSHAQGLLRGGALGAGLLMMATAPRPSGGVRRLGA